MKMLSKLESICVWSLKDRSGNIELVKSWITIAITEMFVGETTSYQEATEEEERITILFPGNSVIWRFGGKVRGIHRHLQSKGNGGERKLWGDMS